MRVHPSVGLLFAACSVTNYALAQSTPDDPLLRAMKAELDREKSLVLAGMQAPYFVEYRLDQVDTYEAVASYGALSREESNRQRVVRVTVRIGDYTQDSSSTRGDGSLELAPTDNDPVALQYALWMATDAAYKNALRAYSTKQAQLKQYQIQGGVTPDFAHAQPVVRVLPLATLDFDRGEWKRRIIGASGLYATDSSVKGFSSHVEYSVANIRAAACNRYLVNSEGTMVRQGYTGYSATIGIGSQASDGMRLMRENGTTAVKASELESASAFHKRTLDNIKSLEELADAPVVPAEDYHGPVLFSGDAATDVFNRLFVPNIESERPEPGTQARTGGAFASSYKSSVLPEMLSVTDDPLKTSFNGKDLLGAYAIDDEGVPAQSVDVVVKGKLESFLVGRTPIRDFPASNGHARAAVAQPAHPHSGVLIVQASQGISSSELNKRLVAMAKEQGRDVYFVETLGGEMQPRLLYRVHPDGKRELVRGAEFDELDNRALRSNIVAAGDDPYVTNTLGPIPQTTIVPSLLFDDVGVKRATVEHDKLPYYEPPPLTGK